ncbi:universal stress protein [Rhizobium ruizarguesonis]|uniref:universal stress protein n=1 Tax=Rhizobium ruizarguesonis TaxID=2081791 RepID=UPI001FDF24EF|nr:universal stress protein [Rhizobium ruizarguesonis]WSH03621.1 universal stress protein [Rhizobium ruizarguesonis]WSH60169.1 universal stress protein [Rhizobium ruizarguesonis]
MRDGRLSRRESAEERRRGGGDTRTCGGEPVGEVLQAKAFELRADLLVMGGFGHSRLREFVLGGATQAVLTNISLPILLSH